MSTSPGSTKARAPSIATLRRRLAWRKTFIDIGSAAALFFITAVFLASAVFTVGIINFQVQINEIFKSNSLMNINLLQSIAQEKIRFNSSFSKFHNKGPADIFIDFSDRSKDFKQNALSSIKNGCDFASSYILKHIDLTKLPLGGSLQATPAVTSTSTTRAPAEGSGDKTILFDSIKNILKTECLLGVRYQIETLPEADLIDANNIYRSFVFFLDNNYLTSYQLSNGNNKPSDQEIKKINELFIYASNISSGIKSKPENYKNEAKPILEHYLGLCKQMETAVEFLLQNTKIFDPLEYFYLYQGTNCPFTTRDFNRKISIVEDYAAFIKDSQSKIISLTEEEKQTKKINIIKLNDTATHYIFYNSIDLFGFVPFRYMSNAPLDFNFFLMVSICAILGGLVRQMSDGLSETRSTPKPALELMRKLLLSVCISATFYILSKTLLISIIDYGDAQKSTVLNPYVVAFVAVITGMLYDETLAKIVTVGRGQLGRADAGSAEQKPQKP